MDTRAAIEVSVVVPTHDRMDVLPEVLAAIEAQEAPCAFELVVVDDGSGGGTAAFLAGRAFTIPARVIRQDNRGPAAARNAGVAAARGRLVAFLGDDTVPQRGWLAAHRAAHDRRGDPPALAVIGYTGWHPRQRRTAFLDYINDHGLQFGYAIIDDPEDVPFNFFYTSNLSLPRALLEAEPFDTGFPYPAWEDIETSYRLTRRRGLKLVYEPRARAAHDHPTDLARFAVRQERAGYSAVVFWTRHPELGSFLGVGPAGPPPLPPEGRQRRREAVVRALQKMPIRLPALWEEVLRYHYIRGLRRAWTELVGGSGPDAPDGGGGDAKGDRSPWP
jgi:glycosyltransferase involved in cell wall biosynthesis